MNDTQKYQLQFAEVHRLIREAKHNINRAVNTALIDLYWNIGAFVHEKISSSEWGKSVVEELAAFINKNEPNSKGFSAQNIWRMKQFYEAYNQYEFLSPAVRELSWANNLLILSKTNTMEERELYMLEEPSEEYKLTE